MHIGPGTFEMKRRKVTHLFDGFAKIYKFVFNPDGTATYSNAFVNSGYYKDSVKDNDIAPYMLAQSPEPPFGYLQRLLSVYYGVDNMNINIRQLGEDTVALSDVWLLYKVDKSTLKTVEKVTPKWLYPIPLKHTLLALSSAHPVREYNSTTHVSFLSIWNPLPFTKSTINVVRITSAEDRELIASIERSSDAVPYMHSLAVSPNYAVVFAHPCLLKFQMTTYFMNFIHWQPKRKTDVYVVRLKDGKVIKLETDPLFFVHHVNSFESDERIISDFITYPDLELFKATDLAFLRNETERNKLKSSASLKRFTIDLLKKTVEYQEFPPTKGAAEAANHLDLPQINDDYAHNGSYCYVYGTTAKADKKHTAAIALSKKDLCHPQNDKIWYKQNHYPSEPFFVPIPGAIQEDDGLLFSIILDGEAEKSYLGVFNARTMELENFGYVPDVIPFLVHGHYTNNDRP